ncbi:MAG: heme o synthase [Gemmataceae bacterium]
MMTTDSTPHSRPMRSPFPELALDEPKVTSLPIRPRISDYFELTKPRIAMMALVTVAVGYLMGAAPTVNGWILFNTLVGAGLVAAGGSALNCVIERRADIKMHRTRNRSVAVGRLSAAEAGAFAFSLTFVGTGILLVGVPNWQAAVAALLTFTLYVFVYTPLKRISAWNTVVGAVPGALPPVIGWCAARGDVTVEGLALFGILFAWQLPHFYAIAWMHRVDYARGGMKMLPIVDQANGLWTGRATVATCLLLIATTIVPFTVQAAGMIYLVGSIVLGVWFLGRCITFARVRDDGTARRVLRGSLVHLLGVMVLLVADGVIPKFLS